MNDSVKICVSARVDFFGKYYEVTPEAKPEVDAFIEEINALGKSCADSVEFEAKFASTGLSDKFNNLLTKCTPMAYKMSAEEKDYSKDVKKEIFKEDKGRIIKEEIEYMSEAAAMAVESEVLAERRRAMSDAGVFDEYTKVTNVIDDAKRIGGFFGGLFRKKKNK